VSKRKDVKFLHSGGIVVVGGTPGDRYALAKAVTRMRRYGFLWKGR
jgi:hypothetical protein